jgi:formylglycine-generating enzyme required for sulfatase activity
VTKGQFQKFVDETHYKTAPETNHKGGFGYSAREKTRVQRSIYNWQNWGVRQADNSPVVNVSWNDASRFCEWLGQREKKNYRLPTEAEWEYACRAGTTGPYYNGNNPEELARIGNVGDAAFSAKFPKVARAQAIGASDGWAFPAPVGTFAPNNFGLFDMTGNVCEWCADWYDPSFYTASPPADPTGPASGEIRVIRGGGWTGTALQCRSAHRWYGPPNDYLWDTGFRVVCAP